MRFGTQFRLLINHRLRGKLHVDHRRIVVDHQPNRRRFGARAPHGNFDRLLRLGRQTNHARTRHLQRHRRRAPAAAVDAESARLAGDTTAPRRRDNSVSPAGASAAAASSRCCCHARRSKRSALFNTLIGSDFAQLFHVASIDQPNRPAPTGGSLAAESDGWRGSRRSELASTTVSICPARLRSNSRAAAPNRPTADHTASIALSPASAAAVDLPSEPDESAVSFGGAAIDSTAA